MDTQYTVAMDTQYAVGMETQYTVAMETYTSDTINEARETHLLSLEPLGALGPTGALGSG